MSIPSSLDALRFIMLDRYGLLDVTVVCFVICSYSKRLTIPAKMWEVDP